MKALTTLLAWAKRNERWLSSLFFLGGFVGDILAFTLLEVGVVNLIFAGYLVAGALAILILHRLSSSPGIGMVRRSLLVLLPLFVQYAVGAILSGSLVFYTKSAALTISWPFLLLLAAVFFGNEVFRNYREHLAFQTGLFFFGFYVYVIFAFPFVLGRIGPDVFLMSTAATVLIFGIFLAVLWVAGRERLHHSVRLVIAGAVTMIVLINAAYFTGVIPPLLLGLKDARIYHSIERTAEGYRLVGEARREWWELWKDEVVHHVPGTPLYAYSAVFAPVRFSTNVVHVWERKNEQGTWVEENRVAFPVSGGRAEGYRGYSLKSDPQPGAWRVSIKTSNGQTVGRFSFTVENVVSPPAVVEEAG